METSMHSRVNAAVAFAIILAFGLGTATANAEEYITVDGSGSILQAGGWNQPATSDDSLRIQSAADVEGFHRALASAIEGWNGTESSIAVDISEFNIPNDDYFALYSGFLNAHGEYFYLSHMMSYWPGDSNAKRAIISFDLSYTKADIDAFNSRVHQIMGEIGATWNDEQKALFLHDYLVSHCQYDLTYSNYNAYNALVEKTAVCQGYSEAYDYLLRLAGLDDDVVSSQALDHAWNLVTIDGRRYYVDCTWDDPSNLKRPAYVGHENFLRSTAGITETGHESTDWIGTSGENVYKAGAANSSTKYDSHYWSDCTSVIPHIGNLWAYTTSSGIYAHNYSSGADIQLVASLETWPVVGSSNSYWPGNYSSLASTGGAFVYTDARNVYTITASGVKTTRYTLTSSQESQGYIYSLIYNEETGDYDCSWYKQYDSDPAGTVSLDLATHVSSVSVSPGSASGELGTTLQLSVTISPADALNQAVSWSSSDESVATVNRDGLVSLLKKGTATITAKSQDKGKAGTATITVTGHPMADADIDLQDAEGLIYNTKAHMPSVTAIWNGVALEEGVDYQVDYSDNTAAGTARATITGTEAGDFEGVAICEFTITPASLDDATVEVGDATYDGTELEPPVTVRVGDIEIPASDYLVEYRDNIDAGTAMVAISPKTGNVTGAKEQAFTIAQASIAQAVVAAAVSEARYTGSTQEPEATVTLGGTLLTTGHDYEIAYADNTDTGTATITATGTGNYTGTASTTFDITPIPVDALTINAPETVTYTGEAFDPVEVLLNGAPLPAGDYRIDYEDNKLPGDASFTFTPTSANIMGGYSGSFRIKGLPITENDISLADGPFIYCAADIEPAVSVTIDGTQLERGRDFTVAYDNHTDAGEATVIVTGAGVYEPDSFRLPFTIQPRDIAGAQVTLTPDTFLADGAAHRPAVSVAVEGIGLLNEGNFEAAFSDAASAAVGAYQVQITGKGNFTGEATASYEIAETKTITDATGVSFTYKLENGEATVVRIDANGATEITVPETLEGNPDSEAQALTVGSVTKKALAGNGQVTYLVVKSADTKLEEGALEGISPNASVSAPAGSPAAEAAAKHDGGVAAAAADAIAGMLPAKVASDADAEAVKAAREAYDALSDAQKAKVDPALVAQLEAAEGAAKEYAAAREKAAEPEKPLPKGAVEIAGSGASKARYKVTASATAKAPGQVSYMQAQTGKAKAANVPATVKIGNYTYKVTAIGANAFKGNTSITSVAIGANVADIGANAFAKCTRLAKVTGAANVASIGASAFSGCKALKTFTLGAKATKVGAKAFFNCKKLAKLTIKSKKLKSVGKQALKGTAAKLTVKSPKAKKAAYKRMLGKAGASKKAKFK